MRKLLKIYQLLVLALFIIIFSGFSNSYLALVSPPQEQLFIDTFEQYVTTKLVRQAYQVWEDGARIEVNLDTNAVGIGTKSLKVDVIGPNPMDNVSSGSIYHSLPLNQRNWSNSSGFRFWIKNPSNNSLWLTFNFKEAYNEYWSVAEGAPYIIEDKTSPSIQLESQYGNLIIPPDFTGWVTIPIGSFSVPDWNTARGDKTLQLSSIESYALGVTVQKDYPRTFYIDNFEVLSSDVVIPLIEGTNEIEIPKSGEHLEKFQAVDIAKGTALSAEWSIDSQNNHDLSITSGGSVIIPSSAKAGFVNIAASVKSNEKTFVITRKTLLTGGAFPIAEDHSADASNQVLPIPTKTAYEEFASNFEKWAMDYRPLFVIISVSVVLMFILILSRFQNNLK